MKKNVKLRERAKFCGVQLWEIAEVLQISESTFYRWLRTELPPEKQQRAEAAIEQILQGREVSKNG